MKRDSFEANLDGCTLKELQELETTLSLQHIRAHEKDEKSSQELERKLLIVQNKITALKIRC